MARKKTYIDLDTGTIYIQDKKSGKMKGRKRVKGFGDRTAVKRVRSNFGGRRKGQILGRTRPIPKSRLTTVKKHKRRTLKGKKSIVRRHNRKLNKR